MLITGLVLFNPGAHYEAVEWSDMWTEGDNKYFGMEWSEVSCCGVTGTPIPHNILVRRCISDPE